MFRYNSKDKDSIFEGTVTKIVYEISDGSLTLCYAFIDSSDQQLDYICTEDLSEAVWEPLTNLPQPTKTKRFIIFIIVSYFFVIIPNK